jgi:predicted nucleic acid-binding protein
MPLVDANLLVYARVASMQQHAVARAWLDGQFSGTASAGLPWPCLLSFVRLVTNPRIFERPNRSLRPGRRLSHGWTVRPYGFHRLPTVIVRRWVR